MITELMMKLLRNRALRRCGHKLFRAVALAGMLLIICGGTRLQAQPGNAPAEENTSGDTESGIISFDEQVKMLTSVYPVTLDKMAQVTQNSYNWQGLRDASMACEIGFTPQAIVVRGKVLDDQPFVQPIAYPSKPDWWQVTYAADGIGLAFEDPTSATNRLKLILNFSSAGLAPKVQVLEAPMIKTAGVLTSADLRIRSLTEDDVPARISDPAPPVAGFRFECAIPTTGLAEPKFFSGPLRMSVVLHDLDGPMETYLKMQETIEKRE